jgi:hypothetical protein
MLIQILRHTPTWVFILFFALIAVGIAQIASRSMPLARVTALPLALAGLSLYGVVAPFATQPLAVLCWACGGAAAVMLVQRRTLPAGTSYDPVTRRFHVPGSVVPLVLMLAIFCTKYAVGVTLGITPQLAAQAPFAWLVSALYGVLSGGLLGRAVRLWRLKAAQTPRVAVALSRA